MLSLAYGAAGNMALMNITVMHCCLAAYRIQAKIISAFCVNALNSCCPYGFWLSQQKLEGQRIKGASFFLDPRRTQCLLPSKIYFDSNYNYRIVFRSPLKGVMQN